MRFYIAISVTFAIVVLWTTMNLNSEAFYTEQMPVLRNAQVH